MATIFVKEVCITNDCDGTSILPEGRYKVKVSDTWEDYETGGHGKGFLVDPKDIELARVEGTTDPKLLKKWGQEPLKSFNPSKVYFSMFDVIP
jgi:hypothetical protein